MAKHKKIGNCRWFISCLPAPGKIKKRICFRNLHRTSISARHSKLQVRFYTHREGDPIRAELEGPIRGVGFTGVATNWVVVSKL